MGRMRGVRRMGDWEGERGGEDEMNGHASRPSKGANHAQSTSPNYHMLRPLPRVRSPVTSSLEKKGENRCRGNENLLPRQRKAIGLATGKHD